MSDEIVRCTRGAYYESRWVPMMSFKAIRLGAYRLQRCPVHRRWELTSIVAEEDLTPEIVNEAAEHPASRVP